jgi:hypothetical protein
MEAMADESVLGRLQDSLASLGFSGSAAGGCSSQRHGKANENERSFSGSAPNMAAEWRTRTPAHHRCASQAGSIPKSVSLLGLF